MSWPKPYRTSWFAFCVFAVFLTARSPVAAASCVVTLEGSSLSEWNAAVAAVNAEGIATSSEAALDCEQALVTLLPEGMVLIFTTRDGRTAKRSLGSPDELAPTLQALSISESTPAAQAEASKGAEVEASPARLPVQQGLTAAPSSASLSSASPPSTSPPSTSPKPAPIEVRHWSTSVLSGARLGGRGLLATLVEADVGYRWSAWRLGLVVNSDLATFRFAGDSGYQGSTIGAGLTFEGRTAWDQGWLYGGLRLLAVGYFPDPTVILGLNLVGVPLGSDSGNGESRVALEFGAQWPSSQHLRWRLGVRPEMVVTVNKGASSARSPWGGAQAITPPWSLGLVGGCEFDWW